MIENMFDSTHHGKTNTSSNQISMYGKDLVDGENNLQFSQYNKSKQRTDSSQAPKRLKYLEKCDKKPAKLNNFSNFLVPNKVFLKSTQPTKKASNANESNEHVSLVARSDENCIVKGKGSLYNEPLLPSSSVCSLEASNDPNFCIRKHEDSDESTYSSDNNEEAEVEEKPSQKGKSVKRARNVESHNLYEKKGRDKMNKKMRILKELIPNCNKVDKASLLDDAIHYLKNLKLQLQIMSMGSGVCIPQMMLTQLCGPGMGLNPWSIIPQFSVPPLSSIKDNNTLENMFGTFSNHHAPNNFIPMIIGNNSSTHLVPTTIPTYLPKHLANSTLDKPNFMEC